METGSATSLYDRLVDKFLVLTRWPTARKVAVSGALAYPIYLLFYGIIVYSQSRGWGRGVLELALLEQLSRLWITISPVITIAAFIEDRRGREGRWTAWAFVLIGGLQLVATIQFFGTVSTSLITLIALTILFVTLFFDTGIGWLGFAWQAFLFAVLAVLELTGRIPYAPLLVDRTLAAQATPVYQGLLLGTLWIVFANLFLRIQFTASIRSRQMALLEERHRELKEAKDRLARSEALSGVATLASGAAHEIRNPLGSCNALMQTFIEDLETTELPADRRERLAAHAREAVAQISAAGPPVQNLHRLMDDVELARRTGRERETLETLGLSAAADSAAAGGPERRDLGTLAWWFSRIVRWPLPRRAVVESFSGMGALFLAFIPMLLWLDAGFPRGIALVTGLWMAVCGAFGLVFFRSGERLGGRRWPVYLLHAVHCAFGLTLCAQLGGMSTSFYEMIPGWVLVICLFYDARTGTGAFLSWLAGSATLAALEAAGLIPYAPAFAGWTVDSFVRPGPYVFLLGVYLFTFAGVFIFVASSERLRRVQERWIGQASRELELAKEAIARSESLAALGSLTGRAAASVGPPVKAAGDALDRLDREVAGLAPEFPGPAGFLAPAVRMAQQGQRRAARILERLGMLQELVGRSGRACDAAAVIQQLAGRYPGIRTEIPSGAVPAGVPAPALEQILAELVDNALKSGSTEPPLLTLSVTGEGQAVISVRDHGRGIPEKLRPDLFKPFSTGDRSGEGHGVGLGLYLVHELARISNGRVEIGCPGGGGTAVTLTFSSV